MDDKRIDLKAALRELADEEPGGAGPHIDLENLIAYREGTLPAAEREVAQEHLSRCPGCTGLLRELRDFEAAAARGDAGPEAQRQEAWDSLVRRLPATTPTVQPFAGAAPPEARQRWRPPRVAAGLAAALLLALAGFNLWAALTVLQEHRRLARLERQLEEQDAALQRSLAEVGRQLAAARQIRVQEEAAAAGRVAELEARIAELSAALAELRGKQEPGKREPLVVAGGIEVSAVPLWILRGQQPAGGALLRGGGEANPVRPASPGGRLAVAFRLAGQPAYPEYRLALLDREGKALWTGRPVRSLQGDAGTSVTLSGLGPGRYRLRVEGLRSGRADLLAEYLLDVGP